MPLKIGVNEPVYMKGITLDDKLSLEIKFDDPTATKPTSGFAAIQDDDVIENTTSSVRIFGPSASTKTDLTEEKKVDLAVYGINKVKGQLQHFMRQYMTTDAMPKLGKVAYNGVPIEEGNFNEQIQKLEIQKEIHKNMCTAFIQAMQPFLDKTDLQFRLLLVRQSKDKHFPALRGSYIEDNPFYESVDVPKEASKLKFTDYEKREGLDDAAPIARPAKGPDATEGSVPLSAESVFGG